MNTTLWPLEPHTLGKHRVLKEYLNAWLPILGSWAGRILFVDGFAGPGEYTGGEPGSPIIALDALIAHNARNRITAEVIFVFIDKDPARIAHLQKLVDERKPKLPPKCQVHVLAGDFARVLTGVLDQLDKEQKSLAPTFLMIDPFGVSDAPMSVVQRVLRHDRSEVYVSFMYEAINRFKTTPEFEEHLDSLFGCRDWREGLSIEDQADRKTFFYELYERKLRAAGAKNVIKFELYKENRLVYAIFFASKHNKGCDRMKQAIWKTAPIGDFQFRGTRSRQLDLGLVQPDFEPLIDTLQQQYRGKGWVGVEEINEFVESDKTDYHSTQLRRNALIPMEDAGKIEIDPLSRKKRRTFPDGTRIRFL